MLIHAVIRISLREVRREWLDWLELSGSLLQITTIYNGDKKISATVGYSRHRITRIEQLKIEKKLDTLVFFCPDSVNLSCTVDPWSWLVGVEHDVVFWCYTPATSRFSIICILRCLVIWVTVVFLLARTSLAILLSFLSSTRCFWLQNCCLVYVFFTPFCLSSLGGCVWKSQQMQQKPSHSQSHRLYIYPSSDVWSKY